MASKPPRGFKRAGQDAARQRITTLLQNAREFLSREELDSAVYMHTNRDESIDGELKIPSPRGMELKELINLLHQPDPHPAAFPNRNYPFLWISIGVRFAFIDEDVYTRYRGLSQVQTNYRRYVGKPGGKRKLTLPLVFLALIGVKRRPGFGPSIERRFRRKVDHVFVRLNWNPDGKQPER
jgi:hypothetical protein